MSPITVGIIGYGAFGQLVYTLLGRFAPTVDVRIASSKKFPDNVTFFSLQDAASSDFLFLCVPVRVFEDVVKRVLPHVSKRTVIIDVTTVKEYTTHILRKFAKGVSRISTHPMWGPESYEKRNGNVAGFRIVITSQTIGKTRYAQITSYLRGVGFKIVAMSAKKHDQHLAETLFLTHFLGQIISHGKFNRTPIDTVSFGYLMDAVESVKNDKNLFKDVYDHVPYCKKVLKRFSVSESAIVRLLEN